MPSTFTPGSHVRTRSTRGADFKACHRDHRLDQVSEIDLDLLVSSTTRHAAEFVNDFKNAIEARVAITELPLDAIERLLDGCEQTLILYRAVPKGALFREWSRTSVRSAQRSTSPQQAGCRSHVRRRPQSSPAEPAAPSPRAPPPTSVGPLRTVPARPLRRDWPRRTASGCRSEHLSPVALALLSAEIATTGMWAIEGSSFFAVTNSHPFITGIIRSRTMASAGRCSRSRASFPLAQVSTR